MDNNILVRPSSTTSRASACPRRSPARTIPPAHASGRTMPRRERTRGQSCPSDARRVNDTPPSSAMQVWQAVILGPDDTPWEGGTFKLLLEFSEDYPNKAPSVRFLTKMFHPNIYNDGQICLGESARSVCGGVCGEECEGRRAVRRGAIGRSLVARGRALATTGRARRGNHGTRMRRGREARDGRRWRLRGGGRRRGGGTGAVPWGGPPAAVAGWDGRRRRAVSTVAHGAACVERMDHTDAAA